MVERRLEVNMCATYSGGRADGTRQNYATFESWATTSLNERYYEVTLDHFSHCQLPAQYGYVLLSGTISFRRVRALLSLASYYLQSIYVESTCEQLKHTSLPDWV